MTLRYLTAPLVVATSVAVAASAQAGSVATCHGFRVTTAQTSGEIIGTPRRDVIRLTGAGRVRSGAGPDIICGSRFADRIESGPGDDMVLGGKGHDVVDAGAGRDTVFGEGGNDRVDGGPGRDTLHPGAGRNRVVSGRTSRVAEENGLAGTEDIVMSGTYAVSLMADNASVQSLMMTGQQYTYAWLPQSWAAQGMTPAWAVARPLQMTTVGIGQGIAGYWADTGRAVPGVMIDPSQMWPVSWGDQLTLDRAFGEISFTGPTPSGRSDAFEILGGPAVPFNPTITGGIAQEGNANGVAFTAPAQMAPVMPNAITSWSQGTRLRVAAQAYVRAGEVLDAGAAPGQYIDVTISPQRPTVALRYGTSTGFVLG